MNTITLDTLTTLLNRGDYVHMYPDGSFDLAERGSLKAEVETLRHEYEEARAELGKLKLLLNTPETEDFDKGVPLEAAHQIKRWGAAHDAGKQPEDWFWLVGYLAGKALAAYRSNDAEKAQHHCISAAAALRNWHKSIGAFSPGASFREQVMRPGISAEKAAIGGAE